MADPKTGKQAAGRTRAMDLMAHIHDEWTRQVASCQDGTREERAAMRDRVAEWLAEYPEAGKARREAIRKELKQLVQEYEDMAGTKSQNAGSQAKAVSAVSKEAPAAKKEPAPRGVAAGAAAEAAHGPVFLGPEGAVPEKGKPVPATSSPEKEGAQETAAENVATGPLPGQQTGPLSGQSEDDRSEAYRESVRHWRQVAGETAGGFFDTVRERGGRLLSRLWIEFEYYTLTRKRAARVRELGGRVARLSAEGRLAEVPEDAGVAQMLSQVDQVDAAMRDNRARLGALAERSPEA